MTSSKLIFLFILIIYLQVFQEFFEIQFDSCENSFEVVDSYMVKHVQNLKNKLIVNDREYISQKKNVSDTSNNDLSNKVSF